MGRIFEWISLCALGVLMIGTWKVFFFISSLVLPLVYTFGMAPGNILGYLLEYKNPGAELGYLVRFLSDIILVNSAGSLTGSSVGISPMLLLVNCTGSLSGIFHGTLLVMPLWFQSGSGSYRC